MRRKLALIIVLVAVSLATVATVYLLQKDEAQAINVFAKASEYSSGSTVFDKMWSFNQAEADKWTKKADMPTARSGLSASEVNGKIYAIGGAAAGVSFSTVEEYNPVTDTWTKKSDMPTRRYALATAAVNGKIYAIGGVDERDVSMSIVEEYDPTTDKWTKRANIPTARFAPAASAVNGKIYVIGGKRPGEVLSTVEEYDPTTDKWTRKSDMPIARERLSASVVNGKIYVIGGRGAIGGRGIPIVEEYDPVTDTWRKKSDMPTARQNLATSAVGGKIYAIGGMVDIAPLPLARLSIVEEYDPKTDTWTKKADMPTARRWLTTSAVNGKIYAIGGGNFERNLSTVEEYDTGFVPPQRVEAKGKLPTTWGKIKAKY